jgi:hypothetical protein
MFACTRFETKQIMDGKACGIVRKYGDNCPHVRGGEIVLTSKFIDGQRNMPFAKIEVQTVRPGTVGMFRRDPIISEMDGYANGEHWVGQMRQLYPGISNEDKVFHIKFFIKEMDKDAGRRGDIN